MTSDVIVVAAPAPCTLEQLAERIRPALAEAGVLRAVVFGSWARGIATGLDLFDSIRREGVTIHARPGA